MISFLALLSALMSSLLRLFRIIIALIIHILFMFSGRATLVQQANVPVAPGRTIRQQPISALASDAGRRGRSQEQPTRCIWYHRCEYLWDDTDGALFPFENLFPPKDNLRCRSGKLQPTTKVEEIMYFVSLIYLCIWVMLNSWGLFFKKKYKERND